MLLSMGRRPTYLNCNTLGHDMFPIGDLLAIAEARLSTGIVNCVIILVDVHLVFDLGIQYYSVGNRHV